MAGCVEGIRRALVLCLVLIPGTAIEQAHFPGSTSSIRISTYVAYPLQFKSSSECSRSFHKHGVYRDTNGAMLSAGDSV